MKYMGLNNLFEEKIINTDKGTLFGNLINLHGLTKVKDNVYISKGKRKYYLTKYGLQPIEERSHKMELQKIQHELEIVSAELVTEKRLRNKAVTRLKNSKSINSNTSAIESHYIKLEKKNLLYLNLIKIETAEKRFWIDTVKEMIKETEDIQYYYDKSNKVRDKLKL